MASPGSAAAPADGVSGSADQAFPPIDEPALLELQTDRDPPDSMDNEKKRRQRDNIQTLKTAILISGIAVAVVGAIFAVTKKLRER
ncbi:hypothetical protein CDL15_Pgr002108 [Punica granatum]|uniref:Uncharacterized protein n=1 Tax=Punica granatum TaxID=22663 RepID=A0A218XC65_PUNGR|nr:hypothetical protein CDL15_Pgr002108 [Punica granatum]